jgi:hypothetical protein
VLRRSAPKRLKLTAADRVLWVWLRRVWAGWKSSLLICDPPSARPRIDVDVRDCLDAAVADAGEDRILVLHPRLVPVKRRFRDVAGLAAELRKLWEHADPTGFLQRSLVVGTIRDKAAEENGALTSNQPTLLSVGDDRTGIKYGN